MSSRTGDYRQLHESASRRHGAARAASFLTVSRPASRRGRWIISLALIFAAACSSDKGVGPGSGAPVLTAVSVTGNAFNALSAIAQFQVTNADSARLLFRTGSEAEQSTPFFRTAGGTMRIPALGLRASARYSVTVEAVGGGGTTRSEKMDVETGALPESLRGMRLAVTGAPRPGYTLAVPLYFTNSPGATIVAFDGAGELRWYRFFPGEGRGIEAKQQPNGHFTAYAGNSTGNQPVPGRFVEFTASGEEVRSYQVSEPAYLDSHEMLLSHQDTTVTAAHLITYEIRPYDLSAVGGPVDAPVALHSIVRLGRTGAREFIWNAADYYNATDWTGPVSDDLVHANSLDIDRDGNYVASFQRVDQIAKIDSRTGALLWRFGGKRSQFTLLDDDLGGFQGQHSARVLANGNILLFDNRNRSGGGRAVEYQMNAAARTARLVWEYRPSPDIPSDIVGSVQRLANGNTVVGFGTAGQVTEVDAARRVVWNGQLQSDGSEPGRLQFYRAIRIGSLYRYVTP